MNILLQQTRNLCKSHNICPSRSRGQNFLIRENVYQKIIKAADLHKDDVVLEVGPGLGFLTEMLARRVKKVVAVELDDRLVEILRGRLKDRGVGNVKVVNENILECRIQNAEFRMQNSECRIQNAEFRNKEYKIVANLPYNITSRFLRKFLQEMEVKPKMMVLMVQREVAERIVANPPKMSLLSVSVQFYADTRIVASVPRENFWPKPKVDSKVIKLNVKRKTLNVDEKRFFKLVRIGFSAKRKQLQNNLGKGLGVEQGVIKEVLKGLGFSEKVRAQELGVDDWQKLYVVLKERKMV